MDTVFIEALFGDIVRFKTDLENIKSKGNE